VSRWSVMRILATWCILAAAGACATAAAQGIDPVESARRQLDRASRIPWYDAENDDLRPVELPPLRDPPPAGDWVWNVKPRRAGTMNWNMRWLWEALEVLAWGLLIAVFVLLTWLIVRSLRPANAAWATSRRSSEEQADGRSDQDRIENLPFDVVAAQSDLLAQARRCYEQGDYGRAIVYFFSFQLVQLDRHQQIRLAKGKTNRQYLLELGRASPLRGLIETSMTAFEDVFFGGYSLSRDRFEQCWKELEEFQRLASNAPGGPGGNG